MNTFIPFPLRDPVQCPILILIWLPAKVFQCRRCCLTEINVVTPQCCDEWFNSSNITDLTQCRRCCRDRPFFILQCCDEWFNSSNITDLTQCRRCCCTDITVFILQCCNEWFNGSDITDFTECLRCCFSDSSQCRTNMVFVRQCFNQSLHFAFSFELLNVRFAKK